MKKLYFRWVQHYYATNFETRELEDKWYTFKKELWSDIWLYGSLLVLIYFLIP